MHNHVRNMVKGNMLTSFRLLVLVGVIVVAAINFILKTIHSGSTKAATHATATVTLDGPTQVKVALIILGSIAFAVIWRTRRQQVRAWQEAALAGLIVVLSVVSFLLAGGLTPLPLVLALFALAGGVLLGLRLVPSIRFWRDPAKGVLWMQGGYLFMGVWLATIIVRYAVHYLATGTIVSATPASDQAHLQAWVVALELDPLFISAGLWIARAITVVQRHRDNIHSLNADRQSLANVTIASAC